MIYAGPMLVVLTLFLLTAVSFAAIQSLRLLTLANATCLLCIPLLASPSTSEGWNTISAGATFYPVVLFGLTLQYLIYGLEAASSSARYILFALLLVFGSMFVLEHGGLLGPHFDSDIRRVGVRFVCFCLAQNVLIHRLNRPSRVPALLRIPVITAAIHLVEGVVFYPCILFGRVATPDILDCTIQCLTIRLRVVALSVPFLALILCLRWKGMPPWLVNRLAPQAVG